jgi:hypothetical protein
MEACSQASEEDGIFVQADGGMLPSRLDKPCSFHTHFRSCFLGREPRRCRETRSRDPTLRKDLVRREEHGLRPGAGIGDLQAVEESGGEMDQASFPGERFHKIEDHCGPKIRESLRGRREIEGNRNRDGLVPKGSQPLRDEIDLHEDIQFVAAGPFGHFSVDNGDFHDPFRMRFRVERMIPAISSR